MYFLDLIKKDETIENIGVKIENIEVTIENIEVTIENDEVTIENDEVTNQNDETKLVSDNDTEDKDDTENSSYFKRNASLTQSQRRKITPKLNFQQILESSDDINAYSPSTETKQFPQNPLFSQSEIDNGSFDESNQEFEKDESLRISSEERG